MKLLFFSLSILLATAAGTKVPEEGDYIMITTVVDSDRGDYIFKNSHMVYLDYDSAVKDSETKYLADAEDVKQLFDSLPKLKLELIKSINEKTIEEELYAHNIIEYRKGKKTYRVCWNENDTTTAQNKKLNKLVQYLYTFW